MRRIVFIIASSVLAITQLLPWHLCKQLVDGFYFNQAVYAFHLQHFFHTDKGLPHIIARAFHNKVTIFFPDVLNAYFHYWDVLFIISLIGLLGAFGFMYTIYLTILKPTKKRLRMLACVLLLPLIITLLYGFAPMLFWLILLSLSWQIYAMYGLWHIFELKNKKIWIGLIALALLTLLWQFVFGQALGLYCIK